MILEKARTAGNSLLSDIDGNVSEVGFDGRLGSIAFTERVLGKGDHVYQEKQPSNELYWIKSGSVKLAKSAESGSEVVKSILGVGSIFGEKSLAGEELRREYAQSITADTVVYTYSIHDVLHAAREDSTLCFNLLGILGNKLDSLERRLESIISKDSRTRIIDFLREMALENGKKVGFETLIKNNFTHKDIASLTGTSRQTVTTTLNSLKEKNVINFDRRRILIRDMDLLV
jgi:CRP/FNR family cyclic AMP-dependent transcriptional regulator